MGSNLVKVHNNWNVCYTCGFDVEDGHTSMTCHMDWRKRTHDVTFTRDNAQQKLAQGCDACMRGMHKTLLPGNDWRFGVENVCAAIKFNGLVSATTSSLDPTYFDFGPIVDDDEVTIILF